MNKPQAVTLTNCDREPIHIPGTIQPFGFLVATSADWMIRHAANTQDAFGKPADEILGEPLTAYFTDTAIKQLRGRLAALGQPDSVERIFGLDLFGNGQLHDVALHFSGPSILIEAEPSKGDQIEVSSLIRSSIGQLGQATSVEALLREGVRQMRKMTGFDRVMAYRFGPTGAGEVAAEALAKDIDSFLGLNYPASDIPQQARALYLRNPFRILADANAEVAVIEPSDRGEPLDLSMSLFRAVSPIHIEYLRNMGVVASLSVSITVDGKLWGLFACHHYSPRNLSFAERSGVELFGQIFSLQLERVLRSEDDLLTERGRDIASRLSAAAADNSSDLANAEWLSDTIGGAIPADGVGVWVEGECSLSGLTPNKDQFERLISALNRENPGEVYATNRVSELLSEAEDYSGKVAGLLAIPVTRKPRDYVVLFRAEELRSVRWAGDQEKSIEHGPSGPRLTPRKSFEEWSELVRGSSKPFTRAELKVAEILRTTLLEVVLRMTEKASEQRKKAAEQQELLIAELNHRVRNILALIRALVGQSKDRETDIEAFVETLGHRIQSLASAHDQLTADQWSPASLKGLIATEAEAYLDAKKDRLIVSGDDVLVKPDGFTVLALVVHELTTNAAKYGALSDSGRVEIGLELLPGGDLRMSWRERGGPAVMPPKRKGFGTTIITSSIPHELGGTSEVHYKTAGMEGEFVIPSRFIMPCEKQSDVPTKFRKTAAKHISLEGRSVLILEDSALIALDAEGLMQEMGAKEVHLASRNDAATSILQNKSIDFAMLDFNLGNESAEPTAQRLMEMGVPFIFATGYGGGDTIPGDLESVPVAVKPYSREQVEAAIGELPGMAKA